MKNAQIKDDQIPLGISHALREKMREGTNSCRKILERLNEKSPEEREEVFDEEFKKVLADMGKTLFDVISFLNEIGRIPSGNKNQDLNFYFWPGYDSILKREENKRVTLEHNRNPCGVGYRVSEPETPYNLSNTCTW